MTVLTVAGLVVAALIVAAVVIAAHRGRSTSGSASVPFDGGALGGVPGYMPGMSPAVQRRETVTSSRVDPPDAATAVDLEGNVARLRRHP